MFCLASLFHVASCKGNNFHTYCPQTSDSWCQYHRDYINKTNLYRPGPGIASDVMCLHGITQNANESLNAMFWERAPKSNCGIDKLQLSVYNSVAVFNYGRQASCDFPKTCLSNAKFIVESKSEEIIMIGLIRFEI